MLGQIEAPTPTPENLTIDNLVKWLVIPWLVVSLLVQVGVLTTVPWKDAFKPFPEELRRKRRRRR